MPVRQRPGTVRATLRSGPDDIRAFGVTGLQGHVTIGGRTVRARSGVADIRTGAPMPVAGSFRIGSDTKTFVSVVVLQLVGEGRLSLDDPVERWLPGVVSGNRNDGSAVTIRMLLQHTSGLHNYTNHLAALGSAEAYREHHFDHYDDAPIVASAMTHAPDFAPGTSWNYSNTNYIVAGMEIRAVTGHSWSSEARARILAPLGMRDPYPGDRPTLPSPHALGYRQFGPGAPLTDVTLFNPTVASAAGGMVSTTADLTTFWRAVQRGVLLRPDPS